MPAEPSAAGYGCREASEVMASVFGRGNRSTSGGLPLLNRSCAGGCIVLSWSAEPASRTRDMSNRLDKERGPFVVRDKPGSEAHCSPPFSLRVESCVYRFAACLLAVSGSYPSCCVCVCACRSVVRVEGRTATTTAAPGSRQQTGPRWVEQSSRGDAGGRESVRDSETSQAEGWAARTRRGVHVRWSRRSDGGDTHRH